MKKLLTLLLIGFFFAAVSCGPRTTEQQQDEVIQPETEQPQMDEPMMDDEYEEVESDTVVVD